MLVFDIMQNIILKKWGSWLLLCSFFPLWNPIPEILTDFPISQISTSNPQSLLSQTATNTSCGGEIMPQTHPVYEQQVVELVNAERANVGLPPLKRVQMLDDAAIGGSPGRVADGR